MQISISLQQELFTGMGNTKPRGAQANEQSCALHNPTTQKKPSYGNNSTV